MDPRLLARMCDSLVHRGPDDQGQYQAAGVGIGMRRLSIVGVDSGHQPIANEDGRIRVLLNGEIYNYRELRALLAGRGHRFRTDSDTECIVHLYEDYGRHCVDYLRGMFALAVLDERDRSLFLARDRLGIKPLFYAVVDGAVVFASELKAILRHPGVPRRMDYGALDAYFAYNYIPAPLTIFRDIRKLPAGHTLTCSADAVKIEKYWDLVFEPELEKRPEAWVEEFRALFGETARMHLMGEVPVGAFLSGGVDSGLLVACMASGLDSAVPTFTIGFGGDTSEYLDERRYARAIAERYRTEHHEHEVSPALEGIIDFIVGAFDEPFADDSVIPSYHICRLARQRVKVALTGLGADELFGGYERHLGLWISRFYERIPAGARTGLIDPAVLACLERGGRRQRAGQFRRFARAASRSVAERYQDYLRAADDDTRGRLYAADARAEMDFRETEELGARYFNAPNATRPLDKALYQDLKTYLPDDVLALSDRLSMHHSLELRVPYVDHKLVEFCATIPDSLKIRRGEKKHLLRKAAAPYLPSGVLEHRKQGFSAPMASWLRTELASYARDTLSEGALRRHGLFESRYVRERLDNHIAGTESNQKLLFALLIFQRWHDMAPGASST